MTDPVPSPACPPVASPQSPPAPGKAELRRRFRRLRREALADACGALPAAAAAAVPALLPPGLRLGLYWPVGGEPDLDPWAPDGLAARLRLALAAATAGPADGDPAAASTRVASEAVGRGQGLPLASPLALPAVLPPGPDQQHGRLIYLPWDPGATLRPDACGIPAPLPPDGLDPVPLQPEQLGLLLVPALAVDRSGLRLGSGGGWYDRLRSDPAWRAVPALAVLPAACLVPQLPRDPWDVPFSGWLTERGIAMAAPPADPAADA